MNRSVHRLLFMITALLMSVPRSYSLARIAVGDKLPPFQCEQTDDRVFRYPSDIKDGSNIILFWASWSELSLVELNDLCSVVDTAHHTIPISILAINVDTQALDQNKRKQMIEPFERYQIKPVFCWDKMGELYSQFGIVAIPSLILIDTNGIVKYTAGGYSLKLHDWIRSGFILKSTETESVTSPNRISAMRYFHTGEQLLSRRKPANAEGYFKRALECDSTYTMARCKLARAQLECFDTTSATNSLWKAVALDRTSEVAYTELSRIYFFKQELSLASCYLDTALQWNKKYYPAQLLWLEMRIVRHDTVSADSLFSELKKSCSLDSAFLILLSARRMLETDTLKALQLLRTRSDRNRISSNPDTLEGSQNENRH